MRLHCGEQPRHEHTAAAEEILNNVSRVEGPSDLDLADDR